MSSADDPDSNGAFFTACLILFLLMVGIVAMAVACLVIAGIILRFV